MGYGVLWVFFPNLLVKYNWTAILHLITISPFYFLFLGDCPVLFVEDKLCTTSGYYTVTGSHTDATNSPEKCQAQVLQDCGSETVYFHWRESNNACLCTGTNDCALIDEGGIDIYKTQKCSEGNIYFFKNTIYPLSVNINDQKV